MAEERLDFENDSPWKGEHYFRYAELKKYISDNDKVLDMACGTGYGTHEIASFTKNLVIGGDISQDSIAECKKIWRKLNLDFRVLDGTSLDLPDQFLDKVVSFETIEHTKDYMAMLREFYRVLKYAGTAFISTPNFLVNSPKGYIENPYHTQEFVLDELRTILTGIFDSVEIFGQKYSRYDNRSVPKAGKTMELILNTRGIRRLPVYFKNKISGLIIGKPFYPQIDDFSLVRDERDILKCQTFFCICKKRG